MRLNSGHLASILAGAGLVAPALTFGLWALRDVPGGIDLMGGPGLTLSFLLLLIAPVFILGFGWLGRVVLAYLDEDEGGSQPAGKPPASLRSVEQNGEDPLKDRFSTEHANSAPDAGQAGRRREKIADLWLK
jgi:hypothetical protein